MEQVMVQPPGVRVRRIKPHSVTHYCVPVHFRRRGRKIKTYKPVCCYGGRLYAPHQAGGAVECIKCLTILNTLEYGKDHKQRDDAAESGATI